ncbi:MAG: hypothetical protein IKQ39_00390 [Oscillospiraceae bacterium]|nr:hypothetical protein [Oscillospiraceae bacterium]
MKQFAKYIIAVAAAGTVTLSIVLFNMLSMLPAFVRVLIIAAICGSVMFGSYCFLKAQDDSAQSNDKKTERMIAAFQERLRISRRDRLPFAPELEAGIRQLNTLRQKQNALQDLLKDTEDSPFQSVGNDVNTYILTNCKHILSRVIIYGPSNPAELAIHKNSLQEMIDDNTKVLTDFEHLLVEISQIGDDITAETPCLNELTQALRSVRGNAADDDWQQPMQMQM